MQNNSREQLFKHTEKSEDLVKGMQFSKLEKTYDKAYYYA